MNPQTRLRTLEKLHLHPVINPNQVDQFHLLERLLDHLLRPVENENHPLLLHHLDPNQVPKKMWGNHLREQEKVLDFANKMRM